MWRETYETIEITVEFFTFFFKYNIQWFPFCFVNPSELFCKYYDIPLIISQVFYECQPLNVDSLQVRVNVDYITSIPSWRWLLFHNYDLTSSRLLLVFGINYLCKCHNSTTTFTPVLRDWKKIKNTLFYPMKFYNSDRMSLHTYSEPI